MSSIYDAPLGNCPSTNRIKLLNPSLQKPFTVLTYLWLFEEALLLDFVLLVNGLMESDGYYSE